MKRVNKMKGCNQIRVMIDEADQPELLPFEVNQHIRECRECEAFAEQRAGLRKLLGSAARVTAPVNFEAVLSTRLAEVKGRRSLAWLGSAGYLRLGAATAGLAVMVFVAQYAGLFSAPDAQINRPRNTVSAPHVAPIPSPTHPSQKEFDVVEPASVALVPSSKGFRGGAITSRTQTRIYPAAEDDGVVLVRGTNGDLDVPMPTVSVGAQPLLYVSAGRLPARNAGASF